MAEIVARRIIGVTSPYLGELTVEEGEDLGVMLEGAQGRAAAAAPGGEPGRLRRRNG